MFKHSASITNQIYSQIVKSSLKSPSMKWVLRAMTSDAETDAEAVSEEILR